MDFLPEKQLFILCGLIGAGKTTYAKNHFQCFTDLDYFQGHSTKKMQIDWSKSLLSQGYQVCHITTYPTDEELAFAEENNAVYLLIDTSLNQCKTNILIRNRERDMQHLGDVLTANEELTRKFKTSPIKFALVNMHSQDDWRKKWIKI